VTPVTTPVAKPVTAPRKPKHAATAKGPDESDDGF
jgi:hypothetical protein